MMPKPTPIYQVDSFTDTPFAGNPAGVCLLDEARKADWMQAVAREMNLAETAFLVPEDDCFDLRWFTPAVEVDLCGHATLASAHILWEIGRLASGTIARFKTRSGQLRAEQQGDWIELDFPATPSTPGPVPEDLLTALGFEAAGIEALHVGRNDFDYLVEVETEAMVRGLEPDFRRLGAISARGVMVTSGSDDPRYDFVSRFFAPAAGIDEDPVTGSAHCCLGPFWFERLGRTELVARQISARGGTVRVTGRGDRILLGGQALTVIRGELVV